MKSLKEKIQLVVDIYKSGDLLEAEQACKELINENSKVAFLYNLLGLILVGQKKFDQAIKYYEQGLKIDPTFAIIYNNLGLLFFDQQTDENIKKAENYYKKSISVDKKIPEAYINLGSLYNSLFRYEESINCYKEAIHINSKFSPAHYNLGIVYITLGRYNEAKLHLKEAIKINPNNSHAHRSLSRITKYSYTDENFKKLKKSYENTNINNVEVRSNLAFALGKAHEDNKDYERSFLFYKEANFLHRKKINFSLDSEKKNFKEIKNTYNSNLFNKFKGTGYLNSSPIFVLGMPRSGTTLVEQILASHPKVFGADEVEFIPNLLRENFGKDNVGLYFDDVVNRNEDIFKKIGTEYISRMKKISNEVEITTDKLPVNFLSIGFIKLILPKSKIIHCLRSPEDNIFSIFKNHFPSGKINFAYNLDEATEYYNLYVDLMKHWNLVLPNFIFNIKYENLIYNTEIEIKNLIKFCNLNWSAKCLKFYENKRPIKTASSTQARSKIYKSSINTWKNYEKYLNEYFAKLKN